MLKEEVPWAGCSPFVSQNCVSPKNRSLPWCSGYRLCSSFQRNPLIAEVEECLCKLIGNTFDDVEKVDVWGNLFCHIWNATLGTTWDAPTFIRAIVKMAYGCSMVSNKLRFFLETTHATTYTVKLWEDKEYLQRTVVGGEEGSVPLGLQWHWALILFTATPTTTMHTYYPHTINHASHIMHTYDPHTYDTRTTYHAHILPTHPTIIRFFWMR